jgi:calcineurin-like phosphoesterase family protein
MNIHLIADTHFLHIKMTEYCNRPADYDNRIMKALCKIPHSDILIHLGDIGMGEDQKVHDTFIKPLKCKKWLVLGNHDHKSNSWYINNGWDFVCKKFYATYYGKRILFSHKPEKDDGYYDLNIHGHFHNSDHRSQEPELLAIKNDKQKLFALEYTNYQPVLLKTFILKI